MEVVIIYRCYECSIKKVFHENELQSYIDFDKRHHEHSGYVMIEKLKDSSTIDAIVNELYTMTSEIMNNKLNNNTNTNESESDEEIEEEVDEDGE